MLEEHCTAKLEHSGLGMYCISKQVSRDQTQTTLSKHKNSKNRTYNICIIDSFSHALFFGTRRIGGSHESEEACKAGGWREGDKFCSYLRAKTAIQSIHSLTCQTKLQTWAQMTACRNESLKSPFLVKPKTSKCHKAFVRLRQASAQKLLMAN